MEPTSGTFSIGGRRGGMLGSEIISTCLGVVFDIELNVKMVEDNLIPKMNERTKHHSIEIG